MFLLLCRRRRENTPEVGNQNFYITGGVQLHFCTWPPDFCQMYMYKNVQKCTKYVFSCLEVPWIDLLAVANLQ